MLALALFASVATDAERDILNMSDEEIDYLAFVAMQRGLLNDAQAAFQEVLRRDDQDAFAHAWLGHLAVRSNDLSAAESEYRHAISKISARMEAADAAEAYALQAKTAELQLMLEHIKDRRATSAETTCSDEESLHVEPIMRLHRRDLSHARFMADFARARRPLIIEGFEEGLAQPYWSLEHLRKVCGSLLVPLRRHANASASWANLREDGETNFASQIDALNAGASDSNFVFDWPLRARGGCSALLEDGSSFSVPSYFTEGTIAAFGPALFVQGNGTKCGLHIDSHSTHFWQYLWSGQKRWRILDPTSWTRLFDSAGWQHAYFRDARCGGLFGAEAARVAQCDDRPEGMRFASDIDAFDDKALRGIAASSGSPITVLEGTLRAGEVLFVPAGSPHQVLNEDTVVATTMNYVDASNAAEAALARLADAGLHPKYRSRLRKAGRTVPGSKTRWYERFKMPWESDEDRRRRLATTLLAHEAPRQVTSFLEPWSKFSRRWWNLDLSTHPDY